ncbi:MAG: hypothetical protein GTO41_11020 [Burkholderiales bacterium]|nr:hypothetical protein [Burkholderiales bacterium]
MATYNKFFNFVEDLCKAVHDFQAAGDVMKIYLSNDTPAQTDTIKSTGPAEISAGGGYTAGGEDTQNTLAETGGTATVQGTKVVWTGTGAGFGPFRYVVWYNDTSTSPADPLISWWDYGTPVSIAVSETFSVKFNASETAGNIFTLS